MASKDDLFFQEVRVLQRRTRCSNFVCEEFIKAYRKFASTPVEKTIKEFDSDAKEAAGSRYIVLNGCPGCNRHVYLPTEKAMTCPFIKGDGNICGHPRFDVNKKPFEVSILRAWVLLAIVYAILILLNLFYLLCVYFIDYSLANILKFLLRRGHFTFRYGSGSKHSCSYQASRICWSTNACGRVDQKTS